MGGDEHSGLASGEECVGMTTECVKPASGVLTLEQKYFENFHLGGSTLVTPENAKKCQKWLFLRY